jgi:hypothetical protein
MKPNPKQVEFLTAREKYVCYGGARGGGKSWVLRIKLILLCMNYTGLNCLLLRETYDEIKSNHLSPLGQMLHPFATLKVSEKLITFPNGSTIKGGYCGTDKDVQRYQGLEYDVIAIDEATHFKEDWIKLISGSLRSVRTDVSTQMFFTTNPGGVGHAYFKRIFIDREYKDTEDPAEYRFISATVYDNTVLTETNPDYVRQLETLPEARRKAWLEGSWDVFEGQVFNEFVNAPEHYYDRKFTHVIAPFEVPEDWNVYRSFDWGRAKPFSMGWWAVDYDGRMYRILEYYGCQKDIPDTGLDLSSDELFTRIRDIERTHPFLMGREIRGVADPAIWKSDAGPSVQESAAKYGILFSRGNNQRVAGWQEVHQRLQFDAEGIPMMYIFNTCKDFIRTVPALIYDTHKAEDVDSSLEDHIADETRYMCMSRPLAARDGGIYEN